MLPVTEHSGTLGNPLIPEDHWPSHSQTTISETCLGDWAGHRDQYKFPGDCHESLTRICWNLPCQNVWGH